MSRTVSDDERERLHEQYGKPPKRDDPLSVERDNMVYVCTIGGPLYSVEKGRVFKTGLSYSDVERSRGMTTHSGAIPGDEDTTYVNVRYGTATMETCYVPEQYVLEVLAEGCEWSTDERGYIPV